MGLEKDEKDGYGQQNWTLYVPDEHCQPGLEIGIVATGDGLKIAGELIPWDELIDSWY